MTRFEQGRFFERPCELRALYALRGDHDRSFATADPAAALAGDLLALVKEASPTAAIGQDRPGAHPDRAG